MILPAEVSHGVVADGFALVPRLLPTSALDGIASSLAAVKGAGQRGMLGLDLVKSLSVSEPFLSAVRPYLPGPPLPVRAIYFDKSPGANWLVPWHQDLTIAVVERRDAPGYGPWSTKEGIIHVQPPADLLGGMVTLRLHLDDTDETNGALKVIPGSHDHGRLSAADIERLRQTSPEVICHARRGDALLMRPLILHASGRSTSDRHRRVLHIEYAGCDLPEGLEWNHGA